MLKVKDQNEAVFDIYGTAKFFKINAGRETIGRQTPASLPDSTRRFAPIPVDLFLSNQVLSGNYEAVNSITVENNVTVSGTANLKAGNTIHLKPGFTAPSGINFTAEIGTVTNVAKRFYYLKDHLGSIRVVARLYLWYKYRRGLGPTKSGRINEAGDIVSSDDYDPCLHAEVRRFGTQAWGMILNGRSTDGSYLNAKYKFTGKERDNETGYDYFACPPKSEGRRRGARYYDSRIGRWLEVDPLTEKYFGWSPYNYTLNNPLIYVDPDGRNPWLIARVAVPVVEALGYATIGTGIAISLIDVDAGNAVTDLGKGIVEGINSLGNPVEPLPFPVTQGEGINQTTIAPSDATGVNILLNENSKEGIYEFPTKTGKEYVGQSKDIPKRVEQHVKSGKLDANKKSNVKSTEVKGGKTAREVAEQKKIDSKGGIKSGNLENKRNPIGEKRKDLLKE